MILDAALLAAHVRHDIPALVSLYTQAAETTKDKDAACFFSHRPTFMRWRQVTQRHLHFIYV